MKLYDANAGNPKRVRIFIAEKGIDIPRQVLELGNGAVITESNAICRYLELAFSERPLIGVNQSSRESSICGHHQLFVTIGLMVRHSIPLFADALEQIPSATQSDAGKMAVA